MQKLVIIEDEEFIRNLYKRQFEKAGYTIDGFGLGQEGLDAIIANKYDLLLLDLMLPDISGIEVLRQIKNNQSSKDMMVVLLTNLGQDDIIKEGFKMGAAGYLIKASFTPEQVVKEVTAILSQQTPPASASTPSQQPQQ